MRKLLPLLTICLILIGLAGSTFIPQTHASFFIVQGTHIAFHSQADLIMGVDFTFNVDTITYGNGSINIGGAWLNSTCDMTLTAFNSGNWTNYTVSSAGSQDIYNGSKPNTVYIDGLLKTESNGWTYSGGTTTVTSATASVYINFGSETVSVPEDEDEDEVSFNWPDWNSILPNFGLTIATAYNMLAFIPIVGAVGFLLVMFYYRRLPGFLTIVELLVGMLILSITMYSLLPFIVEWFEALSI